MIRIEDSKFRKFLNYVIFFFGISIIFLNFYPKLETIGFRAYFSLGILFLAFINLALREFNPKKLGFLLSVLALIVFGFIIYKYPLTLKTGGLLDNIDYLVGIVAILLILIAGFIYSKNLFFLVLIFILYALFGKYFPLPLSHPGFSIFRITNHIIWGSQGIFGITVGVCASYIFLFLLFGEFLKKSGLSKFINDLSLALIGNKPGGPAKVAVIASGLLGMINGSAVANVATTGMITIPLMKKIGYEDEYAAAVEATSSTGGQFAPPIMGAVGFVMAEFLGIPYTKVLIAAIVPALFYYFGILVSVHQEAKKLNLQGLSDEEIPNLKNVLKTEGFLALPIIVVVVLILKGFSPIYASVIGMISTIVASWFTKNNKMFFREIKDAVVEGTLNSLSISISCLLIGIIIGIVSLTALGLNFGNLIMSSSAINNLLTGGILTMIMSIILGMGVPGVAAYVIVVSVAVPILINMGAVPIVAHMFCLIYACLSNITPPVAISSYVAAGISRADEINTSKEAVKIGITGFIFPFFFLLNPQLLIGVVENVEIMNIIRIFMTGMFGVFNIASGFNGYLFTNLEKIDRISLIIIGLLAVDPSFFTDIISIIVFLIVLFKNRRKLVEENI